MSFLFSQGPWSDFRDNSFMDTTAAPILGGIDPNQIWNDASVMWGIHGEKQHLYLVQAFLDNYGHRQICHESIFTWSRMLRGRYIAIRDRYDRLFKTIDLIDNPLQTFYERETEDNHKQETRKSYGTDTRRNDGNAITQDGTTSRTHGEDYGDQQGFTHDRDIEVSQAKSESRSAQGQDVAATDYSLFTDTPQTGYPGAVADGTVYGVGTTGTTGGAGDADAPKSVFNDGFITNGKKNTHNERTTSSNHEGGSSANSSDGERQGRTGENTYNYSQNTGNTSSLSNSTTQAMSTGNQTKSDGGNENEQKTRIRTGFEDDSVSTLLTQYRETCIMLTADFLAEFADLFISVY